MVKKHLPIAIQGFHQMRVEDFYYVDKTAYINQLAEDRLKFVFLSRPRRFGKSLFVSTLREAYSGNKELFEGLAIHDEWDWSVRHPIVHLSFSGGNYMLEDEIGESMEMQLGTLEDQAGITTTSRRPGFRLQKLIMELRSQSGQDVVVLVDEYDKPILDALEDPDIAKQNRDELGAIYGVLKDVSEMIHFCFFTGVSRFAKTSLFSGMNQFVDITVEPKYSAICGYTESDIEAVFGAELGELDRSKIREWYNGYNWLGGERVYNPYDILFLLRKREFGPWWFMTGSPDFIIKTLIRNKVTSVDLNKRLSDADLFSSFDIDHMATETMLFQAGYLTISDKKRLEETTLYSLDYPNREVRQHLNVLLLDVLAPGASEGLKGKGAEIADILKTCNDKEMKSIFQTVFAGIPRQWHSRVDLTQYEAYVASVFYSYIMGAGQLASAEVATSRGRIDLAVTGPSYVYLFEFKMVDDEATGEALAQLREKDYAQQYRHADRTVYLVGVEFSKSKKEIVDFKVVEDSNGAANGPDAT